MSDKKILLVDNRQEYYFFDDSYEPIVDRHERVEDSESVQWSDYAAVFSHYENRATEWSVEKLEEGVIEGVFKFSGGEDSIKTFVSGEFYGLPRTLFKRRFDSFLGRYVDGQSIEECAEVFFARSFDESPSVSHSKAEQQEESTPTRVVTFTRSNEELPGWCSTALPLQTQTDEGKSVLSVNKTLRQLRDLNDPHMVILRDTYFNDGDGLNLLLHLRLSVGTNFLSMEEYSRYPVLVQLSQSLEAWLRRDSDFSILTTKGVRLISSEEDVAAHLPLDLSPLEAEGEHLPILEKLSLSPTGLKARHDLANEWGPIQLWNGLLQLSTSDLSFPKWARQNFQRLTQQRYYKYLFALSALRGEGGDGDDRQVLTEAKDNYGKWTSFLEKRDIPLCLGLIEDESEKGWTEALNGLFADVEEGGTVEAPYDDADFQDIRELVRDVEEQSWDALLVDLRLTEPDRETPSRRADQLSGIQLIKKLKKARPDLPIIAFTASNKAWTAKKLREVGADGYWIKESPEYGVRPAYTRQNAADLIDTLQGVLQQYENAQPIWALVTDVRNLRGNREKLNSFVSLTTGKDRSGEVKKRLKAIEDRLRRAFGYLVMDSSAHEEDAFAFKRRDLAFLTTWSVLNEVASLYFQDPPEVYDYPWERKDLSETKNERRFRLVDPEDQSVKTYWKIENGEVADITVPMSYSLEKRLRPTKQDEQPEWPEGDPKPRIQWLLHRAGASDLAHRMHDFNFDEDEYEEDSSERPPLRNLRNNLEESHGEVSQVWHAELQDVYDLLDIWRAILPV